MTKLLISLCFMAIANLWWIYKAAARYNRLSSYLSPLNPTLRDADNHLSWAIGLFIAEALALIVLLLAGPCEL